MYSKCGANVPAQMAGFDGGFNRSLNTTPSVATSSQPSGCASYHDVDDVHFAKLHCNLR